VIQIFFKSVSLIRAYLKKEWVTPDTRHGLTLVGRQTSIEGGIS